MGSTNHFFQGTGERCDRCFDVRSAHPAHNEVIVADRDAPFWAICHGDTDVPLFFWCGYKTAAKDHVFDRSSAKAVRFCRLEDAKQAGVGLSKGVRFAHVDPVGEQPWPLLALLAG